MAYTKQTWACGDEITAEKLNHMEGGIAEGGCDCGFECVETKTTLTDETVTMVENEGVFEAALTYSTPIDADTLIVTVNGTEYTCNKNTLGGANFYGNSPSSSLDYPFSIVSDPLGNTFYTDNAGTYAVKIESVTTTVETTDCFEKAVQTVSPILRVPFVGSSDGTVSTILASEVDDAITKGYFIFGVYPDGTIMAFSYKMVDIDTNLTTYEFFDFNSSSKRYFIADQDGYLRAHSV